MKTISARYKRLLADPEHSKEIKIHVAGVEYGQDEIYSASISGGAFPDIAIGCCVSREIDLIIEPIGIVPRMAQIEVFSRVIAGGESSEWVTVGVFYTDTRDMDEGSGLLSLHGFDAMLKAESVWWDASVDAGEWPMSQEAAVLDIARLMGVSVDPRTQINPAYKVEYPNDSTMREILGNIAAAHGGNWMVTDDGELLLVPLGILPEETYLLIDDEDGGAILFGEVRIIVR